MSELRDHLRALLTDPGWRWLQETELGHWQRELVNHIGQASNDPDDTLAIQKIRQVVAAHKAVERVFARPALELQKLDQAAVKPEATFSRRGPI